MALATAATVVALPLSVALAGSASAADSGPLGGLPVDASAVTGLIGNSGLPVVGDLLGGVTGGTSSTDPTAAVSGLTSQVSGAAKGTPAEGVVDAVTGITGGSSAQSIKSAATPDMVSGLLSDPTHSVSGVTGGDLPVVGNLHNGPLAPVTGLLAPVTGLVDSLGAGDLVGGLLGTVTGLVDGVTGGLLGNGIDTDYPSHHSHDSRGGDDYETSALPHTGANTDATALMLCAGLAVAGTGVTLVSRRRRGALSI
jgi:hypothetical protein